ncbi:diguanylate cyclase (GGDEF) domain-containing protein [Desulfuromusa kysingii]|uniref:diguanylate cyclase n=1 Tax=Desulfuromusa kysingii TaxID=37625 RepID=A0A1H4C030_9BACT|nr:GGDEF domain-containing protein [Desulfuromusa kysingii]SEA53758.1 diguanylate cyclase (GGDEF) domain-containing protein [Desulfuromusa kysingii]
MRNLFSTVTKKVIIGYLVIVLFSLLAVGYALSKLHQQTRDTENLVNVEFRTFELARDLQQNLLAQENIEKQLLILRDPAISELRINRNNEFTRSLLGLNRFQSTPEVQDLIKLLQNYRQAVSQLTAVLYQEDWPEAQQLSTEKTVPLRVQLIGSLAEFRQNQQQKINTELARLPEHTQAAFQMTVILSLLGICLSAPVSLAVILNIHRSVKELKKATHKISAGRFDHYPEISGNDEFAQLANDFTLMGQKLTELEQLHLDANPLTLLPGNLAIDREIEMRISNNQPFSHLYIDLDNFKVYSDRYGYKAGSDVLAKVGELLKQVVGEYGSAQDLVGHIGGDDYVVLCSIKTGELLAQKIIDGFTAVVPSFYNAEDRETGSFAGEDRYGVKRTFPLMTISIAVISSDRYEYPSRLAISQDCARVKEYLKIQEGSNYMLERRK